MTAYAGVADRRRALLAGFQTHLAKPVDPDDLLAVILSLTFQGERGNEQSKKLLKCSELIAATSRKLLTS